MKYGAGSALLSELIARSSSCCSVCSSTGSLAPAAAVCPSMAGADKDNSRQRKYDFKDDMAKRSVPQAFSSGNVTLGVLRSLKRKREIPMVNNCTGFRPEWLIR